jgi:hypothetical protein
MPTDEERRREEQRLDLEHRAVLHLRSKYGDLPYCWADLALAWEIGYSRAVRLSSSPIWPEVPNPFWELAPLSSTRYLKLMETSPEHSPTEVSVEVPTAGQCLPQPAAGD